MTDIFPRSGGEDKFIAESFGNRASGFKERFKMFFGGLLKTQRGFAPVASVRMTAGQQGDLAIHTPSSSCRSCTFEMGTIIVGLN